MRIAFLCLACLILAACQPGDSAEGQRPMIEAATEQRSVPWTGLEARDDPDDFHFVVVTDRTGQHRPGVFSGAMPKVNLLSPAFVVSVGDLIEGYTEDQDTLDREWDELEGFVAELEAPFFYTPGNHDMSNVLMAETWERRFGPSYYHFTYKGVLFLVLNSELFGMVGRPDVPVPGPWNQDQQMAFVDRVLADHADARWTVVLLHQPLWAADVIDADWLRVEELLGERNYTVFAGHYHRYSKDRRNDRNFITLATTGGGSALRGTLFGEFDHVAWVTMTDSGPRIANLMLDGIASDDASNPRLLAQAEALEDGVAVRAPLDDRAEFGRGTHTVVLTNPSAAELFANPVLSSIGNFDVRGLAPLTLAPGESVEIPLELSVDGSRAYRDLRPAAVTWHLTAEVTGRPALVRAVTPILPLTVHPIPAVRQAPVIDGDLSDWEELAFVVDRQGDVVSAPVEPEDVSFRFDVRQDDEALYVAVDVTDDSLVSRSDRIPREQDTIVVSVDTRDPQARNRSMEVGEAVMGGELAATAMLMLTVEPAARDDLLPFLSETAAATRSATIRSEGGYRTEIAFPHALLNEKAGQQAWQDARITVAVYDFDEGETGNVVLHWQPYRYGAAPLPGSHAFTRANGR